MFTSQHGRMRNLRPILLIPVFLLAACSSTTAANTSPPATASVTGVESAASSSLAAGQTTEQAASSSTQTSDAAGVTITITWAGPSAGAVFAVQMDNHMIDLASVDLSRAVLSNDRSERLSSPVPQGGSSGHHRTDTLTFATSTSGFFAGAAWVQLELPAVGDTTPRDFRWNLTK